MKRFLGIVAACVLGSPALAGMVRLNAPDSMINPIQPAQTVAVARYRISNSNWDQMVATSSSISASTIAGSNNIATHTTLNHAAWNFSFSFEPGEGYTWTLNYLSGGRVSPGTTRTVTWTSPLNGASPTASFNAIQLTAEAGPSMPTGVNSAYVSVSNLQFSGDGLSTQGALVNLVDYWSGLESDNATQWLISDTDLSQHAWTLSGTLIAGFSGSAQGNIDERLRFDARTASVVTVPAPAAITLGAAALGGLGVIKRRSRAHS